MATKIKQQQSFAEKFSLISKALRLVLSLIILIVIIFIGYFFDTSTQIKTLKQLKTKEIYLKNDLASKHDLLKQQAITKHKIAIMEQYVNQNKTQLGPHYDQGYIIEKLHDLGAKQQIQFMFIKPQKSSSQQFYSVLPIDIAATGEYHRVAKFISDIANLDLPIVVTDFALKRDDKSDQFVTVKLIGNIFSLSPEKINIKYYPEFIGKNITEQPTLPKPAATIQYTEMTHRNPFADINKVQAKYYANVILRAVPLSKIELVGIIEEGNKQWAIIMPTGQNNDRITHKATVGDRISQSSALITKIYNDRISLQKDVGDNNMETVTLNVNEDS